MEIHDPSLPPSLPSNIPPDGGKNHAKEINRLFHAAIHGDWQVALNDLRKQELFKRCSMTCIGETLLHIASANGQTKFVEELVKIMDKDDLLLENIYGNTALWYAAVNGNKKVCEILIAKNDRLITIPDSKGNMPIVIAVVNRHHDIAEFLYDCSKDLSGIYWESVLVHCVEVDFFDLASKIVIDRPALAKTYDVLKLLATKIEAFNHEDPHILWKVIDLFFGFNLKKDYIEALKFRMLILKELSKLPDQCEVEWFLELPTPDETGHKLSNGKLMRNWETDAAGPGFCVQAKRVTKKPAKYME